jgi:hypothetical protein
MLFSIQMHLIFDTHSSWDGGSTIIYLGSFLNKNVSYLVLLDFEMSVDDNGVVVSQIC